MRKTLQKAKCPQRIGPTERNGEHMSDKMGLYVNILRKRKRIAAGSGERMGKPGEKGVPTKQDFADAAKTAKKPYNA